MTDKAEEKTEVIEHGPRAAVRSFNNMTDYVYRWNGYAVKSPTGKLLEKCTCELVLEGPQQTAIDELKGTTAFKFMKDRYNLDVADIFKEAIGRLATKPAYKVAETLEGVEAAHKAAQEAADNYKAGQRSTSDTVKVSKADGGFLAKAKASAAALGLTIEEYFERAERVAFERAEKIAAKSKK
jgi:hypothetical protein